MPFKLAQLRPITAPGVRQGGFTLLEVLVAMTITGLAMGGLYSVIAGNKRLAWRSEEALMLSTQIRSVINAAQLHDERGELVLELQNRELVLLDNAELRRPERQTAASTLALRGYSVVGPKGNVVASGTYWVELDLAQ